MKPLIGLRLRVVLLAIAVFSALTLIAASTASATSFTMSLTGSQAGADQDQTWAFTAAPGETVTGLQLRLGGGYWPHMHRVTKHCTASEAASTTGCPAGSRLAAVTAVYSALGIVRVPVTGYLADANGRSDEIAGADALIVLNPPTSVFKRVVKPVTIDIAGQAGEPVVRVNMDEIPALELASGATLRAPLASLTVNGNDVSSGRKRWIRNPTSCAIRPVVTFLAKLSDGSTQTTVRSQNVTGCSSLTMRTAAQFNPKELNLDKSKGFRLSVDLHDHVAGESISDARRIELSVGTGRVDIDSVAELPVCDDAALSLDACPTGSQVGKLKLTSGSDRYSGAEVWNQGISRYDTGTGGSVKLGITLRNGSTRSVIWVGHGVIRDFGSNGGVVVVLDGLPQVDARRLVMVGENPLFEVDHSCSDSPLSGRVTGWSGATRVINHSVGWSCAMAINLTDPRDADIDRDGIADAPFRMTSFVVPFAVNNDGPSSAQVLKKCTVRGWNPAKAPPAAALVDVDGDGEPDACEISGASSGELELEIRAAFGEEGPVHVLTRKFIIDTDPPRIDTGPSSTRTTPSTSFGTVVRVVDDHGVAIVACGVATGAGAAAGAASCVNDSCSAAAGASGDPTIPGDYLCQVESEVEGLARFKIVASDLAGNAATSFFDVFFDRTAPVVTPMDVTDADGDGVADRRFSSGHYDQYFVASDDSFGDPELRRQARRDCRATRKATPWKHHDIQAVDADGDRTGQSVCRFDGLEEGEWDVAIIVIDAAGNAGEHTVGVTVDSTAPVIGDLSPGDGDWTRCKWSNDPYAEDAIRVAYTLRDSTSDPVSVEASVNGGPRLPITIDPTSTSQSADLNVDCREMTTGIDVEYRIFATDSAGNTSDAAATPRIDADPPTLATTSPRDADDDGDGVAATRFRPANFDVEFEAADIGSGLNPDPAVCTARVHGGIVATGSAMASGAARYTCSFEGLAEGDVTVEIAVEDNVGHQTVLKRGFTVDSTPPVIEFASPSPAHTTETSYDVAFTVTDASATVDGAPRFVTECEVKKAEPEIDAPCDSIVSYRPANGGAADGLDGVSSITGLSVGVYHLMLTVTDPAGNSNSASFEIERDGLVDVVFVDPPASVNTARPTFRFSVTGDSAGTTECYAIPEVEDEVLVIFQADCGGTWIGDTCDCTATLNQDLPEGKYFIHAVYRGPDGRMAEDTHEFTVDLTALSVTIVTPSPGNPVIASSNPTDSAIHFVNEGGPNPMSIVCTLNGAVVADPCDPNQTISVTPGTHTLTVNVTAADGSAATDSENFFVELDGSPPVVIDGLADGAILGSSSFVLNFRADNAVYGDLVLSDQATCSLDGGEPFVCANRSLIDGLTDGDHTLQMEASDQDHNDVVIRYNARFRVSLRGPSVAIQTPAMGQTFSLTDSIIVRFSITDGAQPLHTWCYFDGSSTTDMYFDPCSSGFTKSAGSLGGGAHNLTVVSRDALGRQSTRNANFYISSTTQPPTTCIAIYPPPPGCPEYPGIPTLP